MSIKEDLDFEITFFERLIQGKPDYVDALLPLAEAYTRKGLYEKGLVIDKQLVKLRKLDPVAHYNLACSFALTGDKPSALKALARAIDLGYADIHHLKKDPDLRSLHDAPEFKKWIAKGS